MKWSELLAELKTNVAAAQQRRADVEEIKDREALLKVKVWRLSSILDMY
jgi:hypothetical protein